MEPFKQYFADELQFLSEMGQEFADAYPDTARELGMHARDPDVERLLQGVAFLSARVRQSLDAEFPELLYPLLGQLWPNALRPTPAVVMVEFRPKPGMVREVGLLQQGALLRTRPVDGTACTFRTAYPLALFPLKLDEVRTEVPRADLALLRLRFSAFKDTSVTRLGRSPLRLHLHGTMARVYALYHWLATQLVGVRARVLGPDDAVVAERTLPPGSLRQVGWEAGESLLPYPAGTFAGYRHLHEYFLFPAKYLFFDVHGLEVFAGLPPATRLELCFDLRPTPGDLPAVAVDNLRLHCVPAVNLFPGSGRPLAADGTHAQYDLHPEGENPLHYDIFSVARMEAHVHGRGLSQELAPFYSFQRPSTAPGLDPVLYQIHLRPPVCQRPGQEHDRDEARATYPGVDVAVSFVRPDGEPAALQDRHGKPVWDSVSSDLLLTNRDLPRTGKMRSGDLCVATTDIPAGLEFSDIGALSVSAPAPVGADGQWRFAAHLLLGWNHLRDREALRELLRLYHFPARHHQGAAKKLDNLRRAISEVLLATERRVLGRPPAVLYGTHVTVEVHDTLFEHSGELFLFGQALSRFLAETSTINTFTRLTLRGVDQGSEHAYEPRLGQQAMV